MKKQSWRRRVWDWWTGWTDYDRDMEREDDLRTIAQISQMQDVAREFYWSWSPAERAAWDRVFGVPWRRS